MKTLDPEDWMYNGYYDNSNDSLDPKIAHGFNYHQGPVSYFKSCSIMNGYFEYIFVLQEWLWPVGYYLRARIYFIIKSGNNDLINKVLSESKKYLAEHFIHLQKSDWKGLPELTNKDAAYCQFSCPTQAWSMASILEVNFSFFSK